MQAAVGSRSGRNSQAVLRSQPCAVRRQGSFPSGEWLTIKGGEMIRRESTTQADPIKVISKTSVIMRFRTGELDGRPQSSRAEGMTVEIRSKVRADVLFRPVCQFA